MTDQEPRVNDNPDDEAPAEPIMLATPDDPDSDDDWYLWAGVLVLLALGCFLPAVTGQFLSAVDRQFASGVDSSGQSLGIVQIWTDLHTGPPADPQYHPVTLTAYWMLRGIWGGVSPNPVGFRAANLLLHALGVVLLWRLLRRLAIPGAFVIASLWAIHPVQAETLCTISQLKTVLAALFGFGSLWFFFDYADLRPPPDDSRQPWRLLADPIAALIASIVLFLLAVLSEPAVAVLPAAIIPILFWKDRASRNALLGLVPLLAIGIAAACLAVRIEYSPGGVVATSTDYIRRPLVDRLLIAAQAYWFYLGKILMPIGLSALYGKWPVSDSMRWLFLVAALAVPLGLFALRRHVGAGPLTAVAWFGIMLFPHVGFFDLTTLRHTDVADHFQYLPSIAPIALLISGIAVFFQRYQAAHRQPQTTLPASPSAERPTAESDEPPALPGSTRLAMLLALAMLVLFGIDTLMRSAKFTSPVALWTDAIKNPDDKALWPAHRLRAMALSLQAQAESDAANRDQSQGDSVDAEAERAQARTDWLDAAYDYNFVLLAPGGDPIEMLTDLGSTYLSLGELQQASQYLTHATHLISADPAAALNPIHYSTYLDLGIVLDGLAGQQKNGDYSASIAALRHAAELLFSAARIPLPNLTQIRVNAVAHLAAAEFHAKQYKYAVQDQQTAVQLDPSDLQMAYLMAEYLAWDGQLADARKTQATVMANYYSTFGSVPTSYLDFMGVLEMNQDPPKADIAQKLFANALAVDPGNSTIAGHLAAASAFLQWAATTQPTTQAASRSTTQAATAPATKPVPPRDFTIFLEAQAAAVPSTAPSTAPAAAP